MAMLLPAADFSVAPLMVKADVLVKFASELKTLQVREETTR